jgi:hypothetical protein
LKKGKRRKRYRLSGTLSSGQGENRDGPPLVGER